MYKKLIFILLLFTITVLSCRSKKEVDCPSFDIEGDLKKDESKKDESSEEDGSDTNQDNKSVTKDKKDIDKKI